ncbi:MAG: ABC transporter ATP-binding protein [Halanaerobiales bacterium]|nr:ABC transporter ATP-binding protein [Halanaerobiales bacterium]
MSILKNKYFNLSGLVKVPFESSKLFFLLIVLQKVIDGLLPNIQLLLTANFVDIAIEVANKKAVYSSIVLPICLLILLIGYKWFSYQIRQFAEAKLIFALRENLRVSITDKRASLKYDHIENNDTWDLISRVSKEPEIVFKDGFIYLLTFLSLIIQVVGIVIIIATKIWWAAVLIIVMNIPLVYLSIKNGQTTYQADRDVSKYNRKHEYLRDILIGRDSACERTIFGYSESVNSIWNEQYEISRKLQLKAYLKYFTKTKVGGIFTALISTLMIGLLIQPTVNGELTLGLFMAITSNLLVLVQMGTVQLTLCLKEISRSKEYLKDLNAFCMLEEIAAATERPSRDLIKLESIEFKNVYFKYPATEMYILKGISFTLNSGKHYAFVGANGAGKTTVIKLLTGLYDNYEGEILINGKCLRKYTSQEIKAMCSIVYQDFAKYSVSVKDNIALGDINSFNQDENHERVLDALKQLNLKEVVDKMPNKENTPLGKIKKYGVDLSLGQWQRIAIARSLVNKAPLKILDEPTAALDPIRESLIYKEYENLRQDNTTICISHRLGSTKLADEILLFEDGNITEIGTHKELMKKNGLYAQMFENQRSWYL